MTVGRGGRRRRGAPGQPLKQVRGGGGGGGGASLARCAWRAAMGGMDGLTAGTATVARRTEGRETDVRAEGAGADTGRGARQMYHMKGRGCRRACHGTMCVCMHSTVAAQGRVGISRRRGTLAPDGPSGGGPSSSAPLRTRAPGSGRSSSGLQGEKRNDSLSAAWAWLRGMPGRQGSLSTQPNDRARQVRRATWYGWGESFDGGEYCTHLPM